MSKYLPSYNNSSQIPSYKQMTLEFFKNPNALCSFDKIPTGEKDTCMLYIFHFVASYLCYFFNFFGRNFDSNSAHKSVSTPSQSAHSMLRLDATTKKRYNGKLFKFKKFRTKQAFFIIDILSSQVKVHKQKKN